MNRSELARRKLRVAQSSLLRVRADSVKIPNPQTLPSDDTAHAGEVVAVLNWLFYGRKLIYLGKTAPETFLRSRKIKSNWAASVRVVILRMEDNTYSMRVSAPPLVFRLKRSEITRALLNTVPKLLGINDLPHQMGTLNPMFSASVYLYLRIEGKGWVKVMFVGRKAGFPFTRVENLRGKVLPHTIFLYMAPQIYEAVKKLPPLLFGKKARQRIKFDKQLSPGVHEGVKVFRKPRITTTPATLPTSPTLATMPTGRN